MEYYVQWSIDVDADSPEEAAKLAQEMQRDPGTWANTFGVTNDPAVRKACIAVQILLTNIDLDEIDN